jgi:hypothetical protein
MPEEQVVARVKTMADILSYLLRNFLARARYTHLITTLRQLFRPISCHIYIGVFPP